MQTGDYFYFTVARLLILKNSLHFCGIVNGGVSQPVEVLLKMLNKFN